MPELSALRHSSAHILAQAVLRLFPGTKLGVGPALEDGFYYDFVLNEPLSPHHLERIEKEMKAIIKANYAFNRSELSRSEAKAKFTELGQDFKVELINDIPETETISIYTQAEFIDLCRGPHLKSTSEVGAIKLMKISGCYWKGNEHNATMQRIYGTAFPSQEELDSYLHLLEEAEKRDHRRIGKELDLFSTQEKAGPGLIYWHPKGGRIRHIIETFWKEEHYKHGYELIYTPHIGQSWLWETSGHLVTYKENMYAPMQIDEQDYYVKPMNCPFHILIYKANLHSYRDLPLRWAELGTVYRYERSGVLHGSMRVRGFTQDDSHIICTPEQLASEIHHVIQFSIFMWKTFGFEDLSYYVSTRPEKSVGDPEQWKMAEDALIKAMQDENLPYKIDEGGGAFYGPKIDIKIKDALQREWQVSTIQFDFNLPERFDMTYIGADGNKHRPIMIHRALLGSLERFFGILIEHYAGKFPFWLSPYQYRIITVSANEGVIEDSKKIHASLTLAGFRGSIDERNEKLGFKIREAQVEQIPWFLILGDKEHENQQIAVRKNGEKETKLLSLDQLLSHFQSLTDQKA